MAFPYQEVLYPVLSQVAAFILMPTLCHLEQLQPAGTELALGNSGGGGLC